MPEDSVDLVDGGQQDSGSERFAESTDLRWGVVEETIDTEDRWIPEETRVVVHDYHTDGYGLSMGTRADCEATIHFDELRWDDGTLSFQKVVGDERVTTGVLDWHVVGAGNYLGLVGEWILEQIDLEEYRTGVECPKCGSTILAFSEFCGCESPDCDVSVEGVPQDV